MGGHLALTGGAHSKTFFGLRQDHGRRAMMAGGRMIGRMDFAQVVAATPEPVDLVISQGRTNCLQGRILSEKMLTVERTIIGCEGLQLTVHGAVQCINQFALAVACKQRIPVRAPQQLDDIPAGTGKQGFEFVDNVAIAAHRTIEPLQIAVDDEDQIVEFFTRCQRQRGQRFRFIHFAVAEYTPDRALLGREQLAVFQVAQEARLINCADRAQSHRAGRELPEVLHQPGMRIGGETLQAAFFCADLLPVMA